MKTYTLICALLMNSPLMVWGADEAQDGIVINNSIKKLIEVDGVKPLYDSCLQRNTNTTGLSDRSERVFKCLWQDISKNNALKKSVLEAYNKELKNTAKKDDTASSNSQNSRGPASVDANTPQKDSSYLLTKQDNVANNYNSDPAVQALTDFYSKKLDEVLNPEKALSKDDAKNGTILSVDHQKFIQLYKSELGKTIINAFTSYCLDTKPSTLSCSPSSDPAQKWNCSATTALIDAKETNRAKDRAANLASLKTANLESDSIEAAKWQRCIVSVTPNCKENPQTDDEKESSKRACLIVEFVKAARKNIMVADAQIKDYKELDASQTINIVTNTKEVKDPKKTTSDELLELTSKDVEDTLKKPLDKQKAAFEECYKNGAMVSATACKKYLNTNTDENSQALVELTLRQEAKEENLNKELQSDEKVREYLKSEGYSESDITKMTENKQAIATTKSEILDRYKAQKNAIIAEMAAKIENKTSTTNGQIDGNKDLSKLAAIKSEMESRSEDLKNLVQFNNIVSSYLTITDGKNTSQRNTASLFAEVDSMSANDAKDLKQNIDKAKLTSPKDSSNTNVDLNVETINSELVKYNSQPKKSKP